MRAVSTRDLKNPNIVKKVLKSLSFPPFDAEAIFMNKQKLIKKTSLIFAVLCFVTSLPVHAFGSRKPKNPAPAPAPPAPTPSPTPTPTPTPEDPGNGSEHDWDAYFETGRDVDSYRSSSQLTKGREPASHITGSCTASNGKETFAEQIGWAVNEGFSAKHQHLDYLSTSSWDPYDIYNPGKNVDVSLQSHSLCPVDRSSLERTLSTSSRSALMPSQGTIDDINTFVNRHNSLRTRSLQGDKNARKDLQALWGKFMGCLSYIESLGDPDTSRSESVARQYAPSGYDRPQGVNFYIDPNQSEASKLNIGLFQFAPGATGNIQSCIRRWNEANPSCEIPRRASNSEMIRIIGSARQSFNAFCGVSKVLDTLYVQANTDNSYRTDLRNQNSNGTLKAPSDRCVSLHFRTGRSYNHFGPFHNSTGRNLQKLMSCTMAN